MTPLFNAIRDWIAYNAVKKSVIARSNTTGFETRIPVEVEHVFIDPPHSMVLRHYTFDPVQTLQPGRYILRIQDNVPIFESLD